LDAVALCPVADLFCEEVTMSSLADLSAAVSALKGSRVVDLGRTLNMVEVGFERGGVTYRLHAQCPFRVVRGAQILVGSYDMHWPEERKADKDVAFDMYVTMYDSNAKILTDMLAASEFHVIDAEMRENGEILLEIADSVRFEVFPACSGPVESWRLFEKGSDVHYVYPDSSDRD
jgi:hypothetical protein